MLKKFSVIVLTSILFSGCAHVQMESKEATTKAREFNPPTAGNSGLYIYRPSSLGASLKKDVWVDGKCIGETARKVFFYTEVEGNKEHELSTESEFSPNVISLFTEADKNYFVRQSIKVGVFVGGAKLEVVPEDEGKAEVKGLGLATPGNCSK
ncbi:MAG: DUF2846 domain-containing protein [Azoarcus sp.]|jgi:hypothetical protein|nr:DUF2846 domain-containing protein [Azoarcus sp.]